MTRELDCSGKLLKAADIIRSGGVVIFPTETFYGIAADPFNGSAVERVFEIKGRDFSKPLPLIADTAATVERCADVSNPICRHLVDLFWPGSLTILLRPRMEFHSAILGSLGKIGIRVPPAGPAADVARASGGLVTATSANLSGEPPIADPGDIPTNLRSSVDYVLEFGICPGGKPSTVVNIIGLQLEILREGVIEAAVLRDSVKHLL